MRREKDAEERGGEGLRPGVLRSGAELGGDRGGNWLDRLIPSVDREGASLERREEVKPRPLVTRLGPPCERWRAQS